MQTVTLSWTEPTTRADGSALAATDLKGVDVSYAPQGSTTFTSLGLVPHGASQTVSQTLADGNYVARLVAHDINDRVSTPVDVPFTIATSNPSPVTNAKAVIS